MPIKTFHLPDPNRQPPAEQRRQRALIGGAIEQRRLHGTPSDLKGTFVLDPVYRAEHEGQLRDWCATQDPRPLTIEVGFQMGEFAAAYAAQHPERRYLGFEVRKSYCETASEAFETGGVANARVALVDAREMIPRVLQMGSLDELFVFFPDPWWKPRHVKKRLISPEFVADAAQWLRPGGRLLFKSDVQEYADWAAGIFSADGHFDVERLADPQADIPLTLRERRCRYHGRPTWAVEAKRNLNP